MPSESVRSVERAAMVLKVLAESGASMGVSQIAQATGLGKTTAHRLLASLTRADFVRVEPKSRQYSLGGGLLQLTANWLSGFGIRTVALPHLRALRQQTSETVSLNIRDGDTRVAIERLDTSHEVRFVVELGRAIPLHVGATGKAILAFLPESEMHEALESAGTDIGDLSRLHDELAKIRRAGAAISTGERVPGTRSISAPVFGSEGTVIASISILSLESRLDETDITKFQRMVIETAKNVSGDLGFAGH